MLHFTNGDEPLSRKIGTEFLVKFVMTLPREGGTIHMDDVLAYVEKKRRELAVDPNFIDFVAKFELYNGGPAIERWGC